MKTKATAKENEMKDFKVTVELDYLGFSKEDPQDVKAVIIDLIRDNGKDEFISNVEVKVEEV